MKALVSFALLSLGLGHGQTIHDKALNMAVETCKTFQQRTLAQPTDPSLTIWKQVVDKKELIACIDANTASVMAFAEATSSTTHAAFLTVAQPVAMIAYADEHFPEAYDAHTLAQWQEAYAHRDDPAQQK